MIDPDIARLVLLDEIVRLGVPIDAATKALARIDEGAAPAEVLADCLDSIPEFDAALLAAAVLADKIVLQAEIAVRDRERELVLRDRPPDPPQERRRTLPR